MGYFILGLVIGYAINHRKLNNIITKIKTTYDKKAKELQSEYE